MAKGTLLLGRLETREDMPYITDGGSVIGISQGDLPPIILGTLVIGQPVIIKGELDGNIVLAEVIKCLN